jgi:hypothetical protein
MPFRVFRFSANCTVQRFALVKAQSRVDLPAILNSEIRNLDLPALLASLDNSFPLHRCSKKSGKMVVLVLRCQKFRTPAKVLWLRSVRSVLLTCGRCGRCSPNNLTRQPFHLESASDTMRARVQTRKDIFNEYSNLCPCKF